MQWLLDSAHFISNQFITWHTSCFYTCRAAITPIFCHWQIKLWRAVSIGITS